MDVNPKPKTPDEAEAASLRSGVDALIDAHPDLHDELLEILERAEYARVMAEREEGPDE